MAILVAHANVLGYRPGEEFEVDLDDPAEALIVEPYLAGRYLTVEDDSPVAPAPVDLSSFRTVADLRAYAGELGVDLAGARTRAQVEAAITGA